MNNEDSQKKKNAVTAISIVFSGPFCMIVGLCIARYWSNGNPYATIVGMIIGYVFGLLMRKIFVNKK